MVHKLVFSILIDADRLDTASFMVGKSLRPHWEVEKLWQDFSEKLEAHIQQFSAPQNEKMKKSMMPVVKLVWTVCILPIISREFIR